MPRADYEFFEHTADVGLRAYGATLSELFVHAAQGVVELLVADSVVAAREARAVAVQADSIEALLVAWLQDVLFRFQTDHFVPSEYELTVNGMSLRGTLRGERFDPKRHAFGTEIKGVTYHQLRVSQTAHGWEARVIVDV